MGYRKHYSRPHCAEHACLEWRGTEMIRKENFLEISNAEIAAPPKPVPPKPDQVLVRYNRMLTRAVSWEKKFNRAENNLAKVKKEIRAYESRHGERLAS
jgi:hypothetical protein